MAVLGLLLLAAGAAALAGAATQKPRTERSKGFEVYSQLAPGKSELVVYVPTEVERPSITANRAYLMFECDAADGRRLVSLRMLWAPTFSVIGAFHQHLPFPARVVRRVDRCRLNGASSPMQTTAVDAPARGVHPKGPPSDDDELNPLSSL